MKGGSGRLTVVAGGMDGGSRTACSQAVNKNSVCFLKKMGLQLSGFRIVSFFLFSFFLHTKPNKQQSNQLFGDGRNCSLIEAEEITV